MNNFERIKGMTVEELAKEIKLIANWDRKQKNIAEQDQNFYINWLNEQTNKLKGNRCPKCDIPVVYDEDKKRFECNKCGSIYDLYTEKEILQENKL